MSSSEVVETVVDASAIKVAEKLADQFNDLVKDLPEPARITLASAVVGGALVAAGFVIAKKMG